jgi:ABC-type uncharacterized transport system permease subunit
MSDSLLVLTLASVVSGSAPLVLAGIGEAFTEKVGVINLSLDGSIMLSAMAAFAVAYQTNSLALGFGAAICTGALIALLVAFSSIVLKQDQVAVGLVLTLLCTDLADFLGNPLVGKAGPSVPYWPIPGLSQIPIVGPILLAHNLIVYLSLVCIVVAWIWISKTRPGLLLRAVGERPEAAFVRGANVNRTRYLYSALGGALVGCAGAAYSLSVKLGWTHRHTAGFGDRDLWRLASGARRIWRIPVRLSQIAGQHPPNPHSRCAQPGVSGRALCADDLCPVVGEWRGIGAPFGACPGAVSQHGTQPVAELAPGGDG